MQFSAMRLARMKLEFWLAATLVIACTWCVPAQSVPDIVWQTNVQLAAITSVAYSRDSSKLASGSQDQTANVVNVSDGSLVRSFSAGDERVLSVALSPDGTLLAWATDEGRTSVGRVVDGVRLWRSSAGEDIIWALDVSPDGSLLAVGRSSGDLNLRPFAEQFGGRTFERHRADVFSTAFSSSGALLVSGSQDGTAIIWRITDGAVLHQFTGHSTLSTNEDDIVIRPVYSVDFSPDGTLVASSGADDAIRIWRVSDGGEVRVIESKNCRVARFSTDGQLIFAVNDGVINVWRASTGQLLHTYPDAQAGPLAVALNGKYFAYGRGNGSVVLARVPLWMESITVDNGKVTLRWQGGSGRYRVESRPHLEKGDWHHLGPVTTNTTFTHAARSHLFYRVQSLPNP